MSEFEHILKRLNVRKNVFYAVGEFAINISLVFFSYRLVIKQGGLQAVGIWATLYAWTSVIRLGDAGVASAATRFLALWDPTEDKEQIRTYGETACITNLIQFGALATIAYLVMNPYVARIVGDEHSAEAVHILPWMMLGFFLLNVSGTVQGLLQGLHQGFRRSQLSVLGTVIQLVGVLVLVPSYGLMGLAVAQILQHTCVAILAWFIVARQMGSASLPIRFSSAAFRDMLSYSVKVQVVNISNGLVEPVSKMFVGHFGGMATQGLFELAYKTVILPRSLIGSGAAATVPVMARLFSEDRVELKRIYRRISRTSLFAMLMVTIALIVAAPLPSLLWLHRVDSTYWIYVILLTGGFLFNVVGAPAYLVGVASGKLSGNLLATVSALLLLLIVGFPIGSFYGATGVVVVSAISTAMAGLLVLKINKKLVSKAPIVETFSFVAKAGGQA